MALVSMNVPVLTMADKTDALSGLIVPLLVSAAAVLVALFLAALITAGLRVSARR